MPTCHDRRNLIQALCLPLGTLTASLAASGFSSARAQSAWPTKPVRLVIPFPAGGATDIIGRTLATRLSTALGQQIVIENKPGAGGVIGADAVAKSAPDGYSVVLATGSTDSVGPALNPKLPYQADKDF